MRFTTATRLVLDVIMGAPPEDPAWGYRIIDESGLGSGTVYPIVDRLEEAGLIVGEWEAAQPDDRPRRRFYTVTGAGRVWYEQHSRGRTRRSFAPRGVTP
ncbi:MAG TPA: helix-turn-helix transcriptional regulator [Frankiaceae bacterium]|jgi:DNA-binding PadR family transcriptional regulator|nr:helix-turn-helix transcriptional regulator [Frankiaceae bacterium]